VELELELELELVVVLGPMGTASTIRLLERELVDEPRLAGPGTTSGLNVKVYPSVVSVVAVVGVGNEMPPMMIHPPLVVAVGLGGNVKGIPSHVTVTDVVWAAGIEKRSVPMMTNPPLVTGPEPAAVVVVAEGRGPNVKDIPSHVAVTGVL
jgi:hypothetical protein